MAEVICVEPQSVCVQVSCDGIKQTQEFLHILTLAPRPSAIILSANKDVSF